ncbi:S24 family peptidase [Roseicella aquatilis]|uniref:S24 family peptidase n=1 Tax=Roseicella aquatilis TaxID=2527868 RepID=A0A4V2WJK4_9PROT|nr:S24 family peptidase [Roseicella aquatilis]TCZ54593.1 S24 family peptidase [Roseicella aquatilis]
MASNSGKGGADYDGGRTTGFASPAGDAIEGPIDLGEVLDLRRPHRYPVRVLGDALRERGIHPGDILIADAAAPPADGRVCIAMVHGDVWVCQIAYKRGQWWLRPASGAREPLPVVAEDDIEVWAVVAALVRTEV